MTGPPMSHKPYPIPLKYQKLFNEEIQLLESLGCISKSLSQWANPVLIIPKKPDPFILGKQQMHLALDYCFLKFSITASHNGNMVISYYPLPHITDLLARLQNCKIFPSLYLRSRNYHIINLKQLLPLQAESSIGM